MYSYKLLIGLAMLGIALPAQSQEKPKTTPAAREGAYVYSGPEIFHEYCAVCHGTDGKGSGPAASAFRVRPADLTALAKKNSGKFPGAEITKELKSVDQAPHGSHEMPIWGVFFSELSPKSEAVATLRITNLVKHLESLQVK